MIVYIKKLHPNAEIPRYMTNRAAGADIRAFLPLSLLVTIAPGEHKVIECGFAMELPEGFEAQIRPRSGLAAKWGITVLNSPGTIDADYRGEVGVTLINHGSCDFVVKHGDRIAQMVVVPAPQVCFCEVGTLSTTVRGAGGLGSTGVA